MKISTIATACLLATAAAGAQAQAWLDVYAPPNNYGPLGLSAGGQSSVSYNGTTGTNYYLPSSPGTWTPFSGNSPAAGFSGSLGVSADGSKISGNFTAANGFSQAAVYNTASSTWTTLGSLGYNSTTVIQGVRQQGSAMAISSDGSTVVGSAYFNTTGTTGTRLHPVVYKNGQVYDLNPTGTTQTGIALSTNHDGTLIGGYASNSALGMLWKWNGSGYVATTSPTIKDRNGVAQGIQTVAISDNGLWAAGGSVNLLGVNYGTQFSPVTFSQATLWNTATNTGLLIPYDHVIDTSPTSTDIDMNMKALVAGVSDTGMVIGAFSLNLGGNTGILQTDTWIYNAGTGVTVSFDDYLSSLGVGLAPTQHVWNLYSMSADGTAIGGIYFDSATSQSSAFILHTAPVPEPGTLAMFALALPLLARRIVKRRARA